MYNPSRLTDYSEDSILEEIRRVAKLTGSTKLGKTFFTEHGRVGHSTINRKFGSWKNALIAAGLEQYVIEIERPKKDQNISRNLSSDEMIQELQRVAEALGRDKLTVNEFKTHATIGVDSVRRRFGSWKQALVAANLKSVSHGRRYSDQECFNNLLNVWTHYGRQPKNNEMNIPPSTVGSKAYVGKWGSWMKAVHAFVELVETETETVDNTTVSEPAPVPKTRISQENRRDPSVGLRYKVLSRDNFKCVLCGNSPALNPQCQLHVDHIFPFSKGGKTMLENLRTLCKHCNLGKSNKIEIDA